ncbi:hypothetical protein FIBSPDRAFT_847394 [Athelia psychrophila]|uniref:G-patch domain-containing protein n=1 Tax=Athelia psychrophila TaxID=1759441 RepID=A0A166W7Q7_9AGAM|nr:hypothetical protein FIBSPDRAFT_847394 [Fibularhizoctonia sp. CBS 109695]
MPLDGHSYLVAQGWSGKGTGLRQGAISRPLAIPQKKTLSGLGKDRDEAFPFWDHLYTAAASTIKIKVDSDDEDGSGDSSLPAGLKRTSTGILSNRRPATGCMPDSGSTTPEVETPRFSLLSNAKREAAKRGLYSRFFKGPILGPTDDDSDGPMQPSTSATPDRVIAPSGNTSKSRKPEETAEERKERKRLRKESKEAKLLRKEAKRARKAKYINEETEEQVASEQQVTKKLREIHIDLADGTIHKRKKKRKESERTDKEPGGADPTLKLGSTLSPTRVKTEPAISPPGQVKDNSAATPPARKGKRKRELIL